MLDAQSANEILDKTKSVYAAMKSYSDSAVVLDYPDVTSSNPYTKKWAQHSFATYFSRVPRGFLLDYHQTESNRFVVWGDPDSFHTWDRYTRARYDYPNPNNLGAMRGSPAISKIPTLLYAKAPLTSDFGFYENVQLNGTEIIEGHSCYRLVGEAHDQYAATGKVVNSRKLSLWVDTQSFLIRRISQDFGPRPGDGQHTVEQITYQPIANPTIDADKFRFDPPEAK
jgi:outer membrane lipoprotein-sorting protein